jgi:hypothetical protein
MFPKLLLISLAAILSTGCASITTGTSHDIKIDTYTVAGEEVAGAQCSLQNDRGSFQVTSPGNVLVRKSSGDMTINCVAPDQISARGVLTSRASVAMAGNILFGGGVGAIIDHSTGSAYNYPSWVRLVFGQELAFDRSRDSDSGPSPATEVKPGGVYAKQETVAAPVSGTCSPMPHCQSYK